MYFRILCEEFLAAVARPPRTARRLPERRHPTVLREVVS
jgi:hypothetical protein